MRARCYNRASTTDEDQDSSIVNQEHINSGYIKAQGWQHTGSYTDRKTGTTISRKGLQQALLDMQRGEYDVLVAKGVWRLARTLDFFHYLRQFQEAGGHIVVVELGMDTTTAFGRAILGILLIIGALQAEHTGEQVRRSIKAKRERGEHVGPLPLGIVHTRGSYKLSGEPGKLARQIFRRSEVGESATSIRTSLVDRGIKGVRGGTLSTSSITALLRHPLYKDLLPAGVWERAQPRGVGRPLYDTGSSLLHRKLVNRLLVYAEHMPLDGSPLMLRAACKESMSYAPDHNGYQTGKPSHIKLPCPGDAAKTYPMEWIDGWIVERVAREAERIGYDQLVRNAERSKGAYSAEIMTQIEELEVQRTALAAELTRLTTRRDNAIDMKLPEDAERIRITQVEPTRVLLGDVTERIEAMHQAAQVTPAFDVEQDAMLGQMRMVRSWWESGDWPRLRQMVNAMIQRVDCWLWREPGKLPLQGEVEIHWRPIVCEGRTKMYATEIAIVHFSTND